jgi:hypothetical protein
MIVLWCLSLLLNVSFPKSEIPVFSFGEPIPWFHELIAVSPALPYKKHVSERRYGQANISKITAMK